MAKEYTCTDCELHKTCRVNCMEGVGGSNPSIVIVGECPVAEEDGNTRTPFTGDAGKLMRELLREVGFEKNNLYFTYTIKCRPTSDSRGNQKDISATQLNACKVKLLEEIDRIKPKLVILLGNAAMKSTLGKAGIMNYRGTLVEINGVSYLPVINPAAVWRHPEYLEVIAKDIEFAKDCVDGTISEKMETDWELINGSIPDLYEYLDYLGKKRKKGIKRIACDIETNDHYDNPYNPTPFVRPFQSTNPYTGKVKDIDPRTEAKIIAVGFCDKPGFARAIALDHPMNRWGRNLKKAWTAVGDFLGTTDERTEFCFHNGKFDTQYFEVVKGIYVPQFKYDTQLAYYRFHEEPPFGLKYLSWQYTDLGGYDDELDKLMQAQPHGQKSQEFLDIKKIGQYLCGDVDVTKRLQIEEDKWFREKPEMWDLFYVHMMNLSKALTAIEKYGVPINESHCGVLLEEYPKRLLRSRKQIRNLAFIKEFEKSLPAPKKGQKAGINLNSPLQLKKVMYNKEFYDFPVVSRTKKTEEPETGKKAIEPLLILKGKVVKDAEGQTVFSDGKAVYYHELLTPLSKFKKDVRALGSYIHPAKNEWKGHDGRVHPGFNIHGTVTGRLSSESPNGQNIPRDKRQKSVIGCTDLDSGGYVLEADYSQIELRIVACMSLDPHLIEAYNHDKDIHTYAAAKVYKCLEEAVTSEMRTKAKGVNFGLVYGKEARSLSKEWGTSEAEAQEFIDDYFVEFAGVKSWIKGIHKEIKKAPHIAYSLFNRLRHLPQVAAEDKWVRLEALRQSVNFPVQSTAGELTLMSLPIINEKFLKYKLKSHIMLTVHDSIVTDVRKGELQAVAEIVKTSMEGHKFPWLIIPIKADMKCGRTWGECKDYQLS